MTDSVRKAPFFQRIRDNPVLVKELRSRMRGRRAFVLLTLFLTAISAIILLIYATSYATATRGFGYNPAQNIGRTLFQSIVVIQAFLVLFVVPAITAPAITGEKERQSYDLLRTTALSAKSLIQGKLLSALSYVLLLIFVAVPLQSLAFLLGGVDWIELLISQLVLVIAAITYALLGLYFSSFLRTTIASTITTYAFILVLTAGLPILAASGASFYAAFSLGFGTSGGSDLIEVIMAYSGLALASLNLPATLIVSNIFLREFSTFWGFTETFGTYKPWLFSPWYTFIILNLLLAWFLYRRTIRRIERIPVK